MLDTVLLQQGRLAQPSRSRDCGPLAPPKRVTSPVASLELTRYALATAARAAAHVARAEKALRLGDLPRRLAALSLVQAIKRASTVAQPDVGARAKRRELRKCVVVALHDATAHGWRTAAAPQLPERLTFTRLAFTRLAVPSLARIPCWSWQPRRDPRHRVTHATAHTRTHPRTACERSAAQQSASERGL